MSDVRFAPDDREVIPLEWPERAGWYDDLPRFARLLARMDSAWHHNFRIKYLNIRIDTRDCGFCLLDRDDKPLPMSEVLDAFRQSVEFLSESYLGVSVAVAKPASPERAE